MFQAAIRDGVIVELPEDPSFVCSICRQARAKGREETLMLLTTYAAGLEHRWPDAAKELRAAVRATTDGLADIDKHGL